MCYKLPLYFICLFVFKVIFSSFYLLHFILLQSRVIDGNGKDLLSLVLACDLFLGRGSLGYEIEV
jgi:hypothetical protein